MFNEARYAAQVIDAVLAKTLRIEKEVIIVESNSTDGTREIVQGYERAPGRAGRAGRRARAARATPCARASRT